MADDTALPPVPLAPADPTGKVLVGRYRGALDTVRWGYPGGWLRGQVQRALTRKRWFQVGVVDGEHLIVVRIIDQGLLGGASLWVAELATGRTRLDQSVTAIPLANLAVGPAAGQGTNAFARTARGRFSLRRREGESAWQLRVAVPGGALELALDTALAPAATTSVGEHAPGRGIHAQRFVGLTATGTLRLGRKDRAVARGPAWLEYVNGFFPRTLQWSNALVGAPDVGVWLYASDLDAVARVGEDTLWLDGAPRPLRAVGLTPGGPSAPWTIGAPGDPVDLRLSPRASRFEVVRRGPITTRHLHATGRVSGEIALSDGTRRVVRDAFGLAESRVVRW